MEQNPVITRSLLRAVKASEYKPSVIKSLIRHLYTLTAAQLTSFYLQNESLHSLLAEPYLDKFWYVQLTKLNPFDDDFRFCEQSPLCCREILLGYGCAMLKGTTQKEWQQGLALKSFFCAQLLINNHLSSIISQESFDEQKAVILCELLESPDIQTTLNYHQAPGYLLAANTYFSLFASCTEAGLYNAYLLKTFEYLVRAQSIESQSQQAIHNAYFGKGIKESNGYGIETIEGMITAVKNIAQGQKGSHDTKELEALINQAKILSQSIPCCEQLNQEPPPYTINDAKINLEECDEEGNTLLHLALLSHDFAKSKTLAITHPELRDKINKAGLTPLSLATEAGITIQNWLYNLLSSKDKRCLGMSHSLKNNGNISNPKIPITDKWKYYTQTTQATTSILLD